MNMYLRFYFCVHFWGVDQLEKEKQGSGADDGFYKKRTSKQSELCFDVGTP